MRSVKLPSWPALPAVATALFAMLCVAYGSLRPALNYDVVPYAALAKELRGEGGKPEAFRDLAAKVGDARFQNYVSGPYRERMFEDDAYWRQNVPLYTIRPLYIVAVAGVAVLTGDDISATYWVSALATALAVLVSFALGRDLGLSGSWRLAVPLTWIAAMGLDLASLSTPDALATLLGLLFIRLLASGQPSPARSAGLGLLGILMVATRTDAVLLVVFLMMTEAYVDRGCWRRALAVALAAIATYVAIQALSGNYGYISVLNFQLIEERGHPLMPNVTPDLPGYFRALVRGAAQVLGGDAQSALLAVAVSLLTFVVLRTLASRHAAPASRRADRNLIIAAGLLGQLVTRFVLFPAPWARYMMSGYVLAGILFASTVQQALSRRPASTTAAP